MGGYTQLISMIVDLIIFIIPLSKEVLKLVLPLDLKKALNHFYAGLTGGVNWIGYLFASFYYASKSFEIEAIPDIHYYMCEWSG